MIPIYSAWAHGAVNATHAQELHCARRHVWSYSVAWRFLRLCHRASRWVPTHRSKRSISMVPTYSIGPIKPERSSVQIRVPKTYTSALITFFSLHFIAFYITSGSHHSI